MMGAAAAVDEEVRFDRYRLLAGRRQLLAEDGRPVPLGSRALELLLALAERPGDLLSKDELMSRVWPGQIVEECNLAVQVSTLRRVLGAGGDGMPIIATVPGRGYRLVAEVRRGAGKPAPTFTVEAARQEAEPVSNDNLPRELAPLVGRERELAALAELLETSPLVTLVGPAGIGKTTLALAAARRLAPGFADGVWLAELAPLSDPALVAPTVALSLGGPAPSPDPQNLARHLRRRKLLLVLDNCEHLVAAAASLAETLLAACPDLRMVATSQEPLGIPGEQVLRVQPLPLPPPGAEPGDARGSAAVALFLDRVRATRAGQAFGDDQLPAIAELCRRLDGIPLAIELAAARAALLGVEAVAARLDDRLRMLSGGRRTAPVRHQTLRGALDWSHDLLSEPEKRVFRRLGIFAGGFTLEAAEAVAGDADLTDWDVATHVAALVSKSLVVAENGAGGDRYRLLETQRAYALERLGAAGEADRLHHRHADWYCAFFARAQGSLEEMPFAQWHALHMPELDNLRAAQDWAFGPAGSPPLGVCLAAHAGRLWHEAGLWQEGTRRLRAALALADAEVEPRLRVRLLLDLAQLSAWAERLELSDTAASLCRTLGDMLGLGEALSMRGHALQGLQRNAEAAQALGESIRLLEGTPRRLKLARALSILGAVRLVERDIPAARALTDRAEALYTLLQHDQALYIIRVNQMAILRTEGADAGAVAIGRDLLGCRLGGRERPFVGYALGNLGAALAALDQVEEARAHLLEAARKLPDYDTAWVFDHLALCSARRSRPSVAGFLLGFADGQYAATGKRRYPQESAQREALVAQLRALLGGEALEALLENGRDLTLDQAIALSRAAG